MSDPEMTTFGMYPEPEPEPVAWVVYDSENNDVVWTEAGKKLKQNTRLYTYPLKREWQGLTDEEIMSLLPGAVRLPPGWADTVRAIEAKLKEKNNV